MTHPDRHSEQMKAQPFVDMTLADANRRPTGFMQEYRGAPRKDRVRPGQLGESDHGAVDHALRKGSTRITDISNTTRSGVRKRVAEAIEQGMTPAEAGKYVREWSGFDEYRAERIARTEMMFAYNTSALTSYRGYGVQHVVADDGDKDEECADRHGRVYTTLEAEDIHDHPNGTLDWLPVAEDLSPQTVQGELHDRRAIRDGEDKIWEPPVKVNPWIGATKQMVVAGIRDGSVTMDHIAEHRWGWKGDKQGRRVIRDRGTPYTLKHESAWADAYEDARAAVGGDRRFNLDYVRFRAENNAEAAADYGAAGFHRESLGTGIREASGINMYGDTATYVGRTRYAEYDRVDDFYSVVQHELGHAFDYTSKGGERMAFDIMHNAAQAGKAPATRISSELAQVRKQLREGQAKIEEYVRLRDLGQLDEAWVKPRIDLYKDLNEAYTRQEQTLLKLRESIKAAGKDIDRLMTKYAGKSAREDFAESFWYYLNRPGMLKAQAPGRYRFIKQLIEAVQ